jgi:hypothetical protein
MKVLGFEPFPFRRPADLESLKASCGDVLKAVLLHEFFPALPKINRCT